MNLPEVFIEPQRQWVADPSPFKICEKGRRTGMTWAESADDVLIAAADKTAGGQNVYYVGTDQEMTEEYIDACAEWAKNFNRAASEIRVGFWEEAEDEMDRHIKTFSIRFPASRNKILALSSRPRKLRGRQGVLVGDEAAFMDDLSALKKAALAFLIWGGKVRFISTHLGEDNEFNELINDVRAGRQKGTVHRCSFMDAVSAGLYRRVCLRLGRDYDPEEEAAWIADIYAYYGEDAEEELDCIPGQGTGIWLTRALIESCMAPDIPVIRWAPPAKDFVDWPIDTAAREVRDWCDAHIRPVLRKLPKIPSYLGGDYGRTGDLSVFWPLLEEQTLILRTPFTVELANAPFRTQEQILYYIMDGLHRFAGAALDARGIGQEQAERARQRYGAHRIAEVMISESWYREAMPKAKARFEDRTTLIPQDRDILDDFRAFKMIRGVAKLPDKRTKGRDGQQRHGDAGVAYVMATHASHLFAGMTGVPEVTTGAQRATRTLLRGYGNRPQLYKF
jgi:phage FluMu gp28-like protein